MLLRRFSALLITLTLLAPGLVRARSLPDAPTVNLHCTHQELTVVLRKLASQMNRNIYIAPGVSGTVTADFEKVNAEWALGIVLHMQTAKYRYKIIGNTIIVASPDKMSSIPGDILGSHKASGTSKSNKSIRQDPNAF